MTRLIKTADMQNRLSPNLADVTRQRAVVRERLLTSMHHLVFDVFGAGQRAGVNEPALRDLILNRAGYPSAPVFALHGAFLKAALSGDTLEIPKLLGVLQTALGRQQRAAQTFAVTPLATPALHSDDVFLLKRAFADDVGLTSTLEGPPDDEGAQASEMLTTALTLLEQAAPQWHAEVLLLGSQVYLATSPDVARQSFAGAAVFDAFGAVLINPRVLTTPATALMTLVHETSHQQMFLCHLDDPIVLNAADASYSSPLRAQPRPMEGIFHAMWVSARMVVAAQTVLKARDLPDWAYDLRGHLTDARRAFLDCAQTVTQHAELSDLGSALFKDAREAVDGV